jgi:FkbM family methyltransferase
MRSALRKASQGLQRRLNIEVRQRPQPADRAWDALVTAKAFEQTPGEAGDFLALCRDNFQRSHAQLFQDIFVLRELDDKRDGFFVEFGATNGVTLSNTCLLERDFGWKGILAEPARAWHDQLRKNRSAAIETRCVTGVSGQTVTFNEAEWLEVSTIDKWSNSDHHAAERAKGTRYQTETISLDDLLDANDAPAEFDYLSVDTEGSELEILSAFNFDRHRPKIVTVEHNYTPQRKALFDLLTSKGYRRKLERFSLFDDWYVSQ